MAAAGIIPKEGVARVGAPSWGISDHHGPTRAGVESPSWGRARPSWPDSWLSFETAVAAGYIPKERVAAAGYIPKERAAKVGAPNGASVTIMAQLLVCLKRRF